MGHEPFFLLLLHLQTMNIRSNDLPTEHIAMPNEISGSSPDLQLCILLHLLCLFSRGDHDEVARLLD